MGVESLLWYLTVAAAVAGGGVSLAATRARALDGPRPPRANRLYLLSYILMSVSMALFAIGGFFR